MALFRRGRSPLVRLGLVRAVTTGGRAPFFSLSSSLLEGILEIPDAQDLGNDREFPICRARSKGTFPQKTLDIHRKNTLVKRPLSTVSFSNMRNPPSRIALQSALVPACLFVCSSSVLPKADACDHRDAICSSFSGTTVRFKPPDLDFWTVQPTRAHCVALQNTLRRPQSPSPSQNHSQKNQRNNIYCGWKRACRGVVSDGERVHLRERRAGLERERRRRRHRDRQATRVAREVAVRRTLARKRRAACFKKCQKD